MISEELIDARLAAIGVEAVDRARAAAPLATFTRSLTTGNARFGLIAAADVADTERLVARHIIDSVAPWRPIAAEADAAHRTRLFDLGSGPGLPGVPLALVLGPRLRETVLVERRGRRVAFLLGALPALGDAAAIRVREGDAGELGATEAPNLADAIVTFRAFRPTDGALLRDLARVFPDGTPVCALKSASAREELAILAESPYAAVPRIESVSVPGVDERLVLMWRTRR